MNLRTLFILCGLALPLINVAEAKKPHRDKDKKAAMQKKEPHAGAVQKYEKKAKQYAERAGKADDGQMKSRLETLSQSYAELAEHKRAAGKAQKDGKSYDWTDYHATRGQINQMEKDMRLHRKTGNKNKKDPSDLKKHPPKNAAKGGKEVSKAEKDPKPAAPKGKTYKTEDGFKIRTKL